MWLSGDVEEFVLNLDTQTGFGVCEIAGDYDETPVLAIDDNWRVLEMQEKPERPVSHWAVPPFYIYKRDDLALILDSLNHGCGFDAPGNLAHYLVDKTVIHAYEMPGERFDIGSLDTYQEAIKRFG